MYSKLPALPGDTPTKVVIAGTEPGSPASQRLYHDNQGEIGRFQSKARQSREISGNAVSYMQQVMTNGGLMRYAYNNGQETLLVLLTPPEVGAASTPPPAPPEDYWDWALIEMTLPDMTASEAFFSAFIQKEGHDEDIALDERGGTSPAEKPHLEFGNDDDAPVVAELDVPEQYGSLRIDLRSFRGAQTVRVNIYGYIRAPVPESNIIGASVVLKYTTLPTIPGTTFAPEEFGDPRLLTMNGYTIDEVLAALPELASVTVWDGVEGIVGARTETFLGGSDEVNTIGVQTILDYYAQFGGDYTLEQIEWAPGVYRTVSEHGTRYTIDADPGDPDPDWILGLPDDFSPGVEYGLAGYALDAYYMPIRDDDADLSRVATLKSVFFKGEPIDAVAHYKSEDPDSGNTIKEFYRWENQETYPQRWKMLTDKQTVSVPMKDPPTVNTSESHYGMPLLGTAELDIKLATMTWKPA